MNSDRKLLTFPALGSLLFSIGVFQWAIQSTISTTDMVAYTFPNYLPGLLIFLLVVVGGWLLHLHPRYGGIYPSYQRAFDFFIFIPAVYTPILALLPYRDGFPRSSRDALIVISVGFVVILYILHFLLIPLLLRQKRYTLIQRVLNVMLRIRPYNANLYITRGHTLFAQNEFEKAIEAADRAIALTPPLKKKAEEGWLSFKDWRLLNAHGLRMSAYFALDQQEMAAEDAEIIVRLNPQEPLSYLYRGIVATQRGDFAAADADLNNASQLKLDPLRQAYIAVAQGDLAYRQHKNDEAHSMYQAGLKVDLNTNQRLALHPAIYNMLGMIELREGHLEEAQEFCQEAQITNPDFKSAGIALIHAQKGEWDEAVAQWRLIMVKTPRYGNIQSLRQHYRSDPNFVHLIEQIIARLEPAAA